jgi:Pyruvate/2-oxoacid:ferredoxin oxidoreductase delta subunit
MTQSPLSASGGNVRKKKTFSALFGVPDIAFPVIDRIVSPKEQAVTLRLGSEPFSAEEAHAAAAREFGGVPPADFAESAYGRGLFSIDSFSENKGGTRYRIAGFYTRLDVFVLTETELYRSFSAEQRQALDRWYFDAYYQKLSIDPARPCTEDAVITREEAVAFIEREARQAYLADCDCRLLAGTCGLPVRTCISFRNEPNTSAHRGLSQPISKERAERIIIDADKAGLMHTANAGSICNCCADCCYLSRARKKRNAALGLDRNPGAATAWPLQNKSIRVRKDLCVRCGLCAARCPFGLFAPGKDRISVDAARCVGCGLCVNGCPAGALELIGKR